MLEILDGALVPSASARDLNVAESSPLPVRIDLAR
jgi:hypothetical protein